MIEIVPLYLINTNLMKFVMKVTENGFWIFLTIFFCLFAYFFPRDLTAFNLVHSNQTKAVNISRVEKIKFVETTKYQSLTVQKTIH